MGGILITAPTVLPVGNEVLGHCLALGYAPCECDTTYRLAIPSVLLVAPM